LSNYTGTDNLEIMQEAVRYNHYLEDLVFRHANPGDRVLDFGAGIGTFAHRMKDRGLNVHCMEVDNGQAELIRQQGIHTVTSIDEIADNSVDYIYSLNVLEHIENDSKILSELSRCLTPSGKILVYVPAIQFLFSSMDRKVGHFRRYSRASLSRAAGCAGFNVKQSRYADSLGVLATLLYKLSNNQSGNLNIPALVIYDRIVFPISRLLDIFFCRIIGKNVYAILEKGGVVN
jgi:ubiquinone/menaquinone biosynthesis C-methylase UbiE